jgi:5-methylcytosine-specific restriction endonuclease McrA
MTLVRLLRRTAPASYSGRRRSVCCAAAAALIIVSATGCGPGEKPASATHSPETPAVSPSEPSPRTTAPQGAVSRPAGKQRRDSHVAAHHRKPHVSRHRRVTAKTVAVHHVSGVPAADVPDPSLTPGAVLTTSRAVVCVSGYSSRVRDVPDSEKELAYARYGVAHVPYAHEVDHLVSLELGGSNAITNLWPEPYAGRWGARTKDALENRLHDLVCSGSMSLRYAQHIEATDWVSAYKRYVGSPPQPAPTHTTSSQPTRTTAVHSSGGSCEPGYSPCLPQVADLDCADIPADKTPVRVTGSDPYRLDGDGDGYGCTS